MNGVREQAEQALQPQRDAAIQQNRRQEKHVKTQIAREFPDAVRVARELAALGVPVTQAGFQRDGEEWQMWASRENKT